MSSLPNLLTLSRIVAVPAFVALMWDGTWLTSLAAFALFCLAALTDYVDGHLARAHGTVSKLGIFLDPIADKLMVAAVIVMLIHAGAIRGWTVLPALVIILREIAVSGLREFLAGVQVSLPVSKLAKWKTAIQMVALGALILGQSTPGWWPALPAHEVGVALLFLAAALTLVTGWDYLRTGLRHMGAPAPARATARPAGEGA
ncbi:MAG: CDP-diacylglycerol--glycerol-3-phosphate 3-phosphatidyltransferase [Sphingomonadaceae bacterium]|uniref:CDP-diacylglycerol--glycerol-3-phosphate 3-phosphatidyltransferase n=1 Tax=Thermaurantiacus sp. TaxID=2820283 RepID=UPI00298F1A8C|nr:CDP-diacylglycerol--glycerol-3-phosphate 3-phosphatidyltransferase [Thermaurantiacus sp.]MCS6985847.1 CDP-diacylglycerol--glycerol-3-phosphate 3-phosphatidyltransferase [Sphingomonadaceae bacterium]MDW8413884.1 CDP-diacylglycerol--glycerol-3-phosphate 3-phosphatidyltransferase [Thermaurantiacus sp.]